MMQKFIPLLAGVIFGIGLAISGMTQPQKVIGFLDLFGNWDPTLLFVMVGAIAVHFIGYKIILKRRSPLFDTQFHMPTRSDINPRLLGGAAIFGIGWGLGGYCPGPAVTSITTGWSTVSTFIIFMIVGMFVFNKLFVK